MHNRRRTDAELMNIVAAAVTDVTGARRAPRLRRTTRAGQVPGWDSLMHARIVLALEERLGVRIDIARSYEFANVGQFIDYLAELAHAR